MQVRAPLDVRSLTYAVCEAENEGDWDVWRELVAEDVVVDAPVGVLIGLEPNIELVARFRAAVRGYRRRIFDLVCEGDTGAYRFEVTGHLEADGSPLELAGAVFFGTRDGRITRVVELVTRNSLEAPPA